MKSSISSASLDELEERCTTSWSLKPEKTVVEKSSQTDAAHAESLIESAVKGKRQSDLEMKQFALECTVHEYFSFQCKKGKIYSIIRMFLRCHLIYRFSF